MFPQKINVDTIGGIFIKKMSQILKIETPMVKMLSDHKKVDLIDIHIPFLKHWDNIYPLNDIPPSIYT